MAVFPSKTHLVPQIVTITALTVDDFPEKPLTHHVQHHQFFPAVAAVFQQHHRRAGGLLCPHQLPALFHRKRAAHFTAHDFPGPHGVQGNGHMGFPGGRHNHGIYLRVLQQFPIVGKDCGTGSPQFFHFLSPFFRPIRMPVAYGGYFRLGNGQNRVGQQITSPGSIADQADSKFLFHFYSTSFRFSQQLSCSPVKRGAGNQLRSNRLFFASGIARQPSGAKNRRAAVS